MQKEKLPVMIFVAGFLGSGKTTLILKAADVLAKQGKRVAMITNDQDAGLVDTKLAEAQGMATSEVSGGCFCCRFSDLMDASDTLRRYDPDVIFAEPVGSCVDLSATILQPLKAYYRESYRLAPLTVLIDHVTAQKVYRNELGADIAFLFRNQLSEADLICLGKQDTTVEPVELPFPVDFHLSGKTGLGIEEWLNELLEGRRVAGAGLLDIDYKRYAEAEAALGWINWQGDVQTRDALSPAALCGPLLDRLKWALDRVGVQIAHLKVFAQGPSGWVRASISSDDREPVPEGDLLAEPVSTHELAINLRALADPGQLRSLVEWAVAEIPGIVTVRHLGAFRPGEPKPEHRFTTVEV